MKVTISFNHNITRTKFLYTALSELSACRGDVIVYNNSRIIDELNHIVEPIDDVCSRWRELIEQNPAQGVVFFRKKDTSQDVETGFKELLDIADSSTIEKLVSLEKENITNRRKERVRKFKENWRNKDGQ